MFELFEQQEVSNFKEAKIYKNQKKGEQEKTTHRIPSEHEKQEKKTTQEFKKIEEDYKNCINGGAAQYLLGAISSSNYPWYNKSFASNPNSITVTNVAGNGSIWLEDEGGNNLLLDEKGNPRVNPNYIRAKHEATVKSHGFETKIIYEGCGRLLIPTNKDNRFLAIYGGDGLGDCLYYANQLALLINYLKSMTKGGGKLVLSSLSIEIETTGFNPVLVSDQWIRGILSGIQGPKKKAQGVNGDQIEIVNGSFGYSIKEYDEHGNEKSGYSDISNNDSFRGSNSFKNYGEQFLKEIIGCINF